jgi:hypothetical protein
MYVCMKGVYADTQAHSLIHSECSVLSNVYVMQSRTTAVINSSLNTSVFISNNSRRYFFVRFFLPVFSSSCD